MTRSISLLALLLAGCMGGVSNLGVGEEGGAGPTMGGAGPATGGKSPRAEGGAAGCSDPDQCQPSPCDAGLVACGTACVDISADPSNCGACGVACAADQICDAGFCSTSCRSDEVQCGDECVNPIDDPDHCGACGNQCLAGTTCQNGVCVCTPGRTNCGGACVDLTTNPSHCGDCGVVCVAGHVCQAGACSSSCLPSQTQCGDECVSLIDDPNHCGACGSVCPAGTFCADGACVEECPSGLATCSAACVDLLSDPRNCGVCGNECPSGVCNGGACGDLCPAGLANCSGVCVDVLSDPTNCGDCGAVCSAGEVCVVGACSSVCSPDDPSCTGECSGSPFPECADYEPIAIETPTDCSVPRLVDFSSPEFSTEELEFDVTLACVDELEANPYAVTIMGYIPSQGVWDAFYRSSGGVGEIAQDGDLWTIHLVADSIDETVLADVDPCAGWIVGYATEVSGVERYWGMVAGHTVETRRPVAPVIEPSEMPLPLLCEGIPFSR